MLFLDDKDPINEFKKTNLEISPDKLIYVKTKEDNSISNKKIKAFVKISTVNAFGINELTNQILKLLNFSKQSGPVVTTKRQKNLIKSSLKITKQSINMIKTDQEMDLIVSNVRDILFNLETLIGKIYEKDIIDNIFNKFCVGK